MKSHAHLQTIGPWLADARMEWNVLHYCFIVVYSSFMLMVKWGACEITSVLTKIDFKIYFVLTHSVHTVFFTYSLHKRKQFLIQFLNKQALFKAWHKNFIDLKVEISMK